MMPTAVRVDAESQATDLRTTARRNSRASFEYFLKAVLKVPADARTCALLQSLAELPAGGHLHFTLPKRSFTSVHAQGFFLWLRTQERLFGVDARDLTFAGQDVRLATETYSWLFPEARAIVRHAPDISVTVSPSGPISACLFSLHVERV